MTMLRCHLIILLFSILFAVSAQAGTLDDYYLQQFGEEPHLQLQKAVLLATGDLEANRCGMPLKRALLRDWQLLEQSTQKVLAKQLAAPVLTGEAVYTSGSGNFTVHYATSGSDAPPLTDANSNGTPDWVETVAVTFEQVRSQYVTMGYKPAPTVSGAPYDIYLSDQAHLGYYGVTNSGSRLSAPYANSFASWMELDNNFTDAIYKPSLYTPEQSLQITAAHEYHHAIQYGYSFYFDIWYAEATSTWMEDELYDNVNQLYTYTSAWFSNSTTPLDLVVTSNAVSSGAGYARWIFNRYLSESYTSAAIVNTWEKVATLSSPSGNDIPMIPVLENVLSAAPYNSSLGNAFFGFAKRYYQRDWLTHTAELAKIPSATPVTSYSTYPVSSTKSTFKPSLALSHYSFAYYRFLPSVGAPSPLTITLAASSGIKSAAFRKDGGGAITELTFNATSSTYTDSSFSSAQEVVLLIANTTNTDGQNANFSTDGTTLPPTVPSETPVTVITPTVSGTSSSGSSNGCFIATAAYGSYLHPQVQLLRDFRDRHLLTNAPGRAFVALYYRLSPPLADSIARHPLLRSATRLALTPLLFSVAYPATAGGLLLISSGGIVLRLRRQKATVSS